MTACTCAPCGRQFTGLAAFDRHQDVDYDRTRPVICQDPASVGLILGPDGRWGSTDGSARMAATARLAASRSLGRAQSGEQPAPGVTGNPP